MTEQNGDPEGKTDKSPRWLEMHPNPSGIPDEEPLVHKYGGQEYKLEKKSQPIPKDHHEEGSSL